MTSLDPVFKDSHQKPLLFFLVLALFFIVAGVDVLKPGIFRLAVAYCLLSGFTFWGRSEPVGVLRPVNLRTLHVGIGAVGMTVMFLLLLVKKASLPPPH